MVDPFLIGETLYADYSADNERDGQMSDEKMIEALACTSLKNKGVSA